jgi:hypothetical protein
MQITVELRVISKVAPARACILQFLHFTAEFLKSVACVSRVHKEADEIRITVFFEFF